MLPLSRTNRRNWYRHELCHQKRLGRSEGLTRYYFSAQNPSAAQEQQSADREVKGGDFKDERRRWVLL